MANLAIIPARSGSKGLKDKNIKLINGKPLMAYSIEAALNSNLFEEVIVSTDSEEYAKIAQKWGASVPFLRSKELATDSASSWDVVENILLNYRNAGREFNTVALLQPTSPLRRAEDIINGYDLMNNVNANAIVGVCETDHSPLWCNTLPPDHSLEGFLNEEILKSPRQSLPTYYRINGALYIIKTDYFLSAENIYSEKCYSSIMPRENSVDIDSALDFIIAEAIINKKFNINYN